MIDVYVTGTDHTFPIMYFVWVNGKVMDTLPLLNGDRLTWAQMNEIAAGYAEALDSYIRPW